MAPSTIPTSLLALFMALAPLVSSHCSKVTPSSPDTLCGRNSRASTGQFFIAGTSTGQPVQSVGDCAWYCAERSGCTGFFFAPIESGFQICQPFTGPVGNVVKLQDSSPFTIYDAACYSCAVSPPDGQPTESPTVTVSELVESTPAPLSTTQSSYSSSTLSSSSMPPFPAGNSSYPIGTGTGTAYSTPVYSTPVYSTTVESTPVYSTPVYSTPVYSTPVYSTPVYSTPVYSTPVYSTPVYSTPIAYTTSTVYATTTYTISSCAPTITYCPYGSVTTETVALYTTVCPVSSIYNPHDHGSHATYAAIPSGYAVSTVYATNVYTITACPQSVTACPYGSVTTEMKSLYTTICPVSQAGYTSVPMDASLTSALSHLVQTATSSWSYMETAQPVYPVKGSTTPIGTAPNVVYNPGKAASTGALLATGAAEAKVVSMIGMAFAAGLVVVFTAL